MHGLCCLHIPAVSFGSLFRRKKRLTEFTVSDIYDGFRPDKKYYLQQFLSVQKPAYTQESGQIPINYNGYAGYSQPEQTADAQCICDPNLTPLLEGEVLLTNRAKVKANGNL